VLDVFREELGVGLGETTPDGRITLTRTACIGMSDQAPAALVNEVPVTELGTDKVREIVHELETHTDPRRLVKTVGDGNNAHDLVQAMVRNNVRMPGPNVLGQVEREGALSKALGMSPVEVIRALKTARLRGRGGAGFPTGMKWEFARAADGERKYVVGNADEGEPGTFKDRVLLTEKVDRVFAGMTIAGYAVGAEEGILYLRAEYEYLLPYLEWMLARRRRDGLLGEEIRGRRPASFDIRIQMGAGAYVCGEETALLSSCEGTRGDPRNRPPYPAQHGYRGYPTVINNIETLACVTKILADGPATFSAVGLPQSTGTKLLSVSGDCRRPGVYEVPFGISLQEVLGLAGAVGAGAVQVGGPSGPVHGRLGDGVQRRPRSARDRRGVPRVLRGRELRLLHALPRGQRAPPANAPARPRWSRGARRPGPHGADRPDDEGDEPLRPRADLGEPRAEQPRQLPPALRCAGP